MRLLPTRNELKNLYIYLIPIVASLLFFYKIGQISFWGDELVSLKTIIAGNSDDFWSLFLSNHLHPPLYFVLVRILVSLNNFWLTYCYQDFYYYFVFTPFFHLSNYTDFLNWYVNQYFFFTLKTSDEILLRIVPAFSMLFMNIAVFKYFYRKNLLWVAVASCLFIGSNFKNIYYAQEGRPYALLCLLFVLTLIEFTKYFENHLNYGSVKKLVILNVLLLLTHYYAIFVIITELLFSLMLSPKNFRRSLRLGSALAFLCVALGLWLSKSGLGNFRFLTSVKFHALPAVFAAAFNLYYPLAVIAVGCAIIGVKLYLKKLSQVDVVLGFLTLFFGVIISVIGAFSFIKPLFMVRYIAFLAPVVLVMQACFIQSVFEILLAWIRSPRLKHLAFTSAFCLTSGYLVCVQLNDTFIEEDYFAKLYKGDYPVTEAYKVMLRRSQGADINFMREDYFGEAFQYYDHKYKIQLLLHVDSGSSLEERNQEISKKAKLSNLTEFYLLKIRQNRVDEGPVQVVGYRKEILLARNQMVLFRFIKQR